MQPTVQQRLTNLIRGGMAFTLATTLMVPTTALAEASAENSAAGNSAQAEPADGADSQDAAAQDAADGSGDAAQAVADEDGDANGQVGDGNEKVTIIVQLEENGDQGVSLFSNIFGTQQQDRHSYFKDKVRELAQGEGDAGNDGGVSLLSTFGSTDAAADTTVDEVHDYYNVIDGFAVKAPAKTLDAIKNLDGVKNAFIEHEYSVPVDQQDSGVALKNQASLDITQADEIDQKGDGQVIAIIDTGIDTDHEAFSGDLDDSKVALTQDGAAQARKNMKSGGQNGTYISEKIPFAYDYADGDAEVNPGISGLEHGTHVAGIASANGGQIRGTAPDAQLAVMKVASDADGGIYDSALIAALDDVPAIGANSVNISIGADAGFADEGAGTYNDAINSLENKGITVNVAAGNSYSAANKNQSGENLPYATDPDSSIVSVPATVDGSFAVASMNTDKVEVEQSTPTYLTAADGTKMQYADMKAADGLNAGKFSDLADGDYEVVWGGIGRNNSGEWTENEQGDTADVDVKGKIVLVQGQATWIYDIVIPYSRALNYYTEKGAAAVVFYNDDLGDDVSAQTYDDADGWLDGKTACPSIIMGKTDALALKAAAQSSDSKTVKVSKASAAAAQSAFQAADGTKVAYGDVKTADGNAPAVKWSSLADGDYDYVWCNIARGSGDYDGEDYDGDIDGDWSKLKGKIALVRGNGWFLFEDNVYSYDQMVNQCQNAGAVGVIVFDDRYDQAGQGQFSGDGWLSSQTIPVVQVGYEQGQALRDAANKKITVKQGMETDGDKAETKSYYAMSSYSSWGVTPDLKLKPEIAAPGGNVYSSINNNQYAYYSGTSMATPQITGIASLVHQYVDTDEKFANLSEAAKARAVTQLLMSTATPMVNPDDAASYYSPRQQGAGLANAVAATSSDVLASVDGAEDSSRPKADVGESTDGKWSFAITLRNLGGEDRAYTPDTAALSEKVADGLFQQQSENWTGKGISVSYAGDCYDAESGTVTVPAGGIANLTVSVTCEDAFKQFAAANTPNGTFVDGFAMLHAADEDGVDLSVPFLGFYGDWSDAPVFDAMADGDYHIYGTKLVDAVWGETLGVNPMAESDDQKKVDTGKVVLSNSGFDGAPTTATTRTGLLRNADNITISVTGPDGSDEGSVSNDFMKKSFWHQNAQRYVCTEDFINNIGYFMPGSDENSLEGAYTFKETATTAGPTPEQQSIEFTAYYDTTAPELSDVSYSDNDGDPMLTFTVRDNTFAASVDLVSPDANGITPYSKFYRVLLDDSDLTGTDADGAKVYKVSVKVSDIKAAWGSYYGDKEMPNTVRAYAWDYGKLVSNEQTAVVTPVAATSVKLSADSLAVSPNQTAQLSATVAPEDATETKLVWSSSDEQVASVDENGLVTGLAEGDATITCAVADRPEVKAEAKVKVANVSADQGVVLSSDSVRTVKDGDAVSISALLCDSLKDAKVEWASSDDQVFSVAADGDDATKAKLTGGYQVGDATLTVTVEKDGVTKTATAAIANRTADYDDFIIDENHVLRGYNGSKTTIIIPNDVTEIGDQAFHGDMQVTRVGIPASVERIGVEAFAPIEVNTDSSYTKTGNAKEFSFEDTEAHPSHLREIATRAFASGGVSGYMKLPEGVTTLGEEAFEGDLGMSGVYLPDSIRTIPDRCFKQAMIGSVEMSDNVTSIGNDAFSTCLFLTQIKLHHTAEGAAGNGLPSKLESIGESAFSATYLGAEGTSDIVIPGTVKEVPTGCFSGDRYITSITLGEGVESIGYSAFGGMWGLTSVTLPDSLVSTGGNIFQDCEYLKEVNVGRNLGVDQLKSNFSWCYRLGKVNIPDDAVNYTSKDGAVYTKDMTELVYVPTAKTGTLSIPEGVTKIDNKAFESTSLSSIELPDSLQVLEKGSFTKQVDVLDLGSNIVDVASEAFRQEFYADDGNNAGYTPTHLIVRGGLNGSYSDTKKADKQQTAYFGEGMTNLTFDLSGAPGTLVVPASLEQLDLSGNTGNPSAVTVYAPAGSNGYNVAKAALEAIGADPAKQLKEYVPLAASVELDGLPGADGSIPVAVSTTGGVDGAKQYRFIQVAADGTEQVVRDWSSASTFTWNASEASGQLIAEVRDATMLSERATYGTVAPTFSTDLPTAPVSVLAGGQAPVLSVFATASAGADVTYQWYRDGQAIEGATSATLQPDATEAGEHSYYVVATASKDGMTSLTASSAATIKVVPVATAPIITADLPTQVRAAIGAGTVLTVGAASEQDGGVLTYQWYCDGQPIDGAIGASYQVASSTAGTHEYSVRIVNTVGLADNTADVMSSTAKVSFAKQANVSRLAGQEASQTADAVSSAAFDSSDWVVIARDDDFADAMSATGLAGQLHAPILLVNRDEGISSDTAAEIERLGAKHAYVIGGKGAIPADVEGQLSKLGIDMGDNLRVFGAEAADTSVACANKIVEHGGSCDKAVVAYGGNFQDALSMSSFAYKYGAPILLQTGGDSSADRSLTDDAKSLLVSGAFSGAKVFVAGGAGAVSTDSVEGVVGSDLRGGARIFGESGYDTSNAIAGWMTTHGDAEGEAYLSADTVVVASGAQAAHGTDALAGAALAGKDGGVVLLVSANDALEAVDSTCIDGFLASNAGSIGNAYVLGGTTVVPEDVLAKISDLLAL